MLQLWPKSVPLTFVGFEAGVDVRTGIFTLGENARPSPCQRAYAVYCEAMLEWCVPVDSQASESLMCSVDTLNSTVRKTPDLIH